MPIRPDPIKVIVSVKVSDGSFESDISWPVAASAAERRGALDLWIAMLDRAITVSTPHEEVSDVAHDDHHLGG